MDKRSILFVVCLTAAYFGLNSLFGFWRGDEQKAHEIKAAITRQEKIERIEKERLARTAPITDFPLIELFADSGEKIATALKIDDLFLTLAWKSSLPEKLFAEGRLLTLASSPARQGDPVLYSSPDAKPVELPPLPQTRTDLQLLTLTDPQITLALCSSQGNELTFPYTYLEKAAIALIRTQTGYSPVGVYEPSMKKIRQLRDFERLQELVQQSSVALSPPTDSSESFYVLQNQYQQLVFSTRGGSLAEINLPLQVAADSKSVVKEIDIDRQILNNSPQNARFPLHPYFTSEGLQTEGAQGGFYPLLRRSILKPDGTEKSAVSPSYYALNIVSDEEEIANVNFKVAAFTDQMIRFEGSTGGRRITKTYALAEKGPYCFDFTIEIDGDASGLWLTSGVPDVELVGGSYAPQLKYQVKAAGGAEVEEMKLPKETAIIDEKLSPYWISNCNGFLGLILDPLTKIGSGYQSVKVDGTALPSRLTLIDPAYQLYPAANYPGYATLLPLSSGKMDFRIFAGPYDEELLKELDGLYADPSQNYNPEYNLAISIQGWFSFISQPFSKFLFLLMQLFYTVSQSWAVSIVLLTIALRAMMYPLNNWSIRSTIKMQEVAPRVKAVQEKHKKDPKKAQLEVMALYKEAGVNPFSGCLPMLLQMPFLIGMFYMLKSSFPLRGAPFIPGWIDDLAAPDVLFSWGQPIWIIGNSFHLLPILTGLVMFIQGKMTQKVPKDASQLTDAEKQQKMMGTMMAVLFTVMFYSFPSGLNIYFMFSTLLGILQQKFLMKKHMPKAGK